MLVSLAAAADPASSPWIGNVVTPVILLGLIIGGVLVPGRQLKRAEEQLQDRDRQIERKDAELTALNKVMSDQVVPALTHASEALREAAAEAAIRRRL